MSCFNLMELHRRRDVRLVAKKTRELSFVRTHAHILEQLRNFQELGFSRKHRWERAVLRSAARSEIVRRARGLRRRTGSQYRLDEGDVRVLVLENLLNCGQLTCCECLGSGCKCRYAERIESSFEILELCGELKRSRGITHHTPRTLSVVLKYFCSVAMTSVGLAAGSSPVAPIMSSPSNAVRVFPPANRSPKSRTIAECRAAMLASFDASTMLSALVRYLTPPAYAADAAS